jgi:hypothetical protein
VYAVEAPVNGRILFISLRNHIGSKAPSTFLTMKSVIAISLLLHFLDVGGDGAVILGPPTFLQPDVPDDSSLVEHKVPNLESDVPPQRRLTQYFAPLGCNKLISIEPCRSFVATFGYVTVYSKRFVIPCGKCFILDHPASTLTFRDGLEVQGKLIVGSKKKSLTIKTPMVVVQGELSIKSTKPVNGVPAVKFLLTGGDVDQYFRSFGNNAGVCDGGLCDVGIRSISVAGGTLIRTYFRSFAGCSIVRTRFQVPTPFFLRLDSQWTVYRPSRPLGRTLSTRTAIRPSSFPDR